MPVGKVQAVFGYKREDRGYVEDSVPETGEWRWVELG